MLSQTATLLELSQLRQPKAVKRPSRTWLEEALGLPSFNKAHAPPPAGHSAQARRPQARAEWVTGQKASAASGRFGDYHVG